MGPLSSEGTPKVLSARTLCLFVFMWVVAASSVLAVDSAVGVQVESTQQDQTRIDGNPLFVVPDADTCNAADEVSYPTAPAFSAVGDTLRVRITLGAGSISSSDPTSCGFPGNPACNVTINKVRFELACSQDSGLGIPCTTDDATLVVRYLGNITDTCGATNWTDSGPVYGVDNEVVFTPTSPIVIPAQTVSTCTFEFDVKIETLSGDSSPTQIAEVAGFRSDLNDAVCSQSTHPTAGNTSTGIIKTCPTCNACQSCNETTGTCDTSVTCDACHTCNTDTGACDQSVFCNACQTCNTSTGACDISVTCDACHTCNTSTGACDMSVTCDACHTCNTSTGACDESVRCNDNNACTDDVCDPVAGCVHTDNSARCNDNNACTTDLCDPVQGCINTPGGAAASSSISSNFNGTSIPAGRAIWFNANFKVSPSPLTTTTTIRFTNGTVTFASGGQNYLLIVPDAVITFSPGATCATTSFNTALNRWETIVPLGGSDEIFLSGFGFTVPVSLPGGINPVTWSGDFQADQSGISISWKWSAAVYTTNMSNYNTLGVKPTHTNACLYPNSDHAGTPENKKSFVTGGARGGGGSNFTGSWSATKSVALSCPTGIVVSRPGGLPETDDTTSFEASAP